VTDAFTATLAEQRIEVQPDQLTAVRGASKRDAIRQFIPDGPNRGAAAAAAYASFVAHLARRYRARAAEPVAGAEDVFRWLRARRVRVALNTGFDRDITDLLIAALGWRTGVVDAVVCGDDVAEGRPAPLLIRRAMEATGAGDAQRVANVGDTVLDLQAGHNAGVRWNIGVLSGAHDRRRLEQAPHTHLLDSVADLAALWEAQRNALRM
jgi:phosphonatase-like hydrolase